MMKRILILLILFHTFLKAQSDNFGDRPLPVPSIDSYSTYVNTPISPATGIPKISIPVFNLETNHPQMSINVNLQYHPYNAKAEKSASEVGLGWSLFKESVISRKVGYKPDELEHISSPPDDIFYYNLPHFSGKFQFNKDSVTGNYYVNHLSENKIKIEFEADPDPVKLLLKSFKITDDQGFQYIFNDYDISLRLTSNYKSAFHITKILDYNNQEIVTYLYDYKIKYMGTSSTYKYRLCKINEISTSRGKIRFTYNHVTNEENRTKNDPYQILNITLLATNDSIIKQYKFEYASTYYAFYTENNDKRLLAFLIKQDKNSSEIERIAFEYDHLGSDKNYGYYTNHWYGAFLCPEQNTFVNPKFQTLGILKKIIYPTKGYVLYDFEANEIYKDRSNLTFNETMSDPEIWYYDITDTFDFNTNSPTTMQYQLLGNYPVFINYDIEEIFPDPHGNYSPPVIRVKKVGDTEYKEGTLCESGTDFPLMKKYSSLWVSGLYDISVVGRARGKIRVYQLKAIPPPYKNSEPVKPGVRLHRASYYDSNHNLQKATRFEYSDFSFPNNSSGYEFVNDTQCDEDLVPDRFVLYKNVKQIEESSNGGNGYTRYYFKTPNDYKDPLTFDLLYYNITSLGVMEKQEIYNRQNQLVSSSEYDYNFQNIPNVEESLGCMIKSVPAYTTYSKEISKLHTGGTVYQTVSEAGYNAHNFQPAWKKKTSADGTVNETLYRYAQEKSNTRLLNANMIVTPLETETKLNGITVSKSEILYENPGHLNPTSVISYDLQNVPETQMVFDVYDSKGNPVQATGKSGIPTTTIWGYHQTLPVASISGAAFSQVSSLSSVLAVISASDADADDPMQEPALLLALENLRTDPLLKDYVVSGITYDPLVGVTHTISPNGIRITREYDTAGRLKKVKNASGETLKEYEYHYKP